MTNVSPWIIRTLTLPSLLASSVPCIALHLNLLSMALQNASCASLISFEVWIACFSSHRKPPFVECSFASLIFVRALQKELNSLASLISIQRDDRNWSFTWLVIKSYINLQIAEYDMFDSLQQFCDIKMVILESCQWVVVDCRDTCVEVCKSRSMHVW